MDRNREARRTTTMAASNGLSRRRHRTSLRDSPEEDGPVELPETVRLRDRGGSGKKEKDRDRDRDRDRERDRDRDRLSRSKRRRADRLMHGSNREDGGDESSEESVNDEEEDDDGGGDGGGTAGSGHMRVLPPPPGSSSSLSSSLTNHGSRRSFPPAATAATKMFRSVAPWKAADEMIGVSVPRKARSASTKRSHEWLSSSGHVNLGSPGEQVFRQASTSPVRSGLVATTTASPVRPVSPSSSNASARKKMKANGPKPRLPKSSSKSSSSDQDEIEIEIAEVLYGMMRQPQVPSSKYEAAGTDSMRFETRDESRFSGDAKSRISSPTSNFPSAALHHPSSILPQNSSSVTAVSALAPRRKKPRPVKYDENQPILPVRGSPISALAKAETDQAGKIEAPSPNLDRVRGSAVAENGGAPYDLAAKLGSETEPVKPEMATAALRPDSKLSGGGQSENREAGETKEEPHPSPKKESCGLRLHDDRVDNMTATKANEIETQREEKFQIDLMAPPPSRSSPERDGDIDFAARDPKPMVSVMKTEVKPLMKDDEKAMRVGGGELGANASSGEVKASLESHKQAFNREKNMDLQLDLERNAENGTSAGTTTNKLNQTMHKQQQQSHSEKPIQPTNSLTFPMSVAGWPGGLPPMGYMAPLQGVVSMDGSAVAPAAIQQPQMLFNQPRPKKCATHCYIARNIHYHQQFTRMNPFWPAAAGSASIYGAKPCNLNSVPSAELPGRAAAMPEKAQNLGLFPGKDSKPSPAANSLDPSQRKQQQIMLQQTLPPGAPSNILQGPAFIFPLSQQHAAAAAAAASVRPGLVAGKSQNPGGVSASTSASTSASATAAAAATAMSFSYPNMPGGETQYLAILQNNGYPFPVPAHVGAAPTYRGTHAQAMPFFNGSFYSSQMLHPSQLQQQGPAPQQTAQSGHQNSSMSSGSTSSQKHLQHQQQQRQLHASMGNGSLQGFPASGKGQPSQQQHQHSSSHHSRSRDHEASAEDSPLSADARVARSNVNIYGQNFTMPGHPPNFALMSPAQMAGANSGSGNNQSEKKQHQQQMLGPKATGFDSLPSQAFAMSFGSLNNSSSTTPGLDISSISPNHPILQSLPEAARHSYQMFAAAAAAQTAHQKKNYRSPDDGKNGGNDAAPEEERKHKGSSNMGQSIAFSRQDLTAEAAGSSLSGSNVVDSSARTLNLGSANARSSGSVIPAVVNTLNAPASQQQLQRNQQQQIMQLQKQHQFAAAAAAAARNKPTATSNVSVCTEQQLPPFSSAAAAAAAAGKSPNALSPFQQNLVQSSTSPNQSPQWKNSPRATPGASSVPSSFNSTSSGLKNHHQQQQGRPHQGQTQISFAAANSKGPNSPQVVGQQQLPSSNQSSSPPLMVGSPTTSSMSKSAGGSPRTTPASTGNKTNQASTLSAQQVKGGSPLVGGHKSSGGPGSVPSMLGNSHIMTSSGVGTKHQLPQQLSKQQQAQLFFTRPYVQVQPPHSTSPSAGSATSGYYQARRNPDPKALQQQPPQGSSAAPSSSGMLSLCSPVSLANSSTCDPVKAVAASSMKGGGMPTQGILHAAQFAGVAQTSVGPHQIVPAGFPYIHAVSNAVQAKAAEQNAAREESRRSDT